MLVNTKGIPKAAVLSALFNNARGFGIGILVDMLGAQTGAKSMSIGEAEALIENVRPHLYFDYVSGRLLKVDLSDDDSFDSRLYDRDYGDGAAERAIAPLRKQYS